MDYEQGDVVYETTISHEEARTGARRTFAFHAPTGDIRTITVDIPAGVRSGDFVCVPGAGGPARSGDCYGDFYARICVVAEVPTTVTSVEAALERGWPLRSS